jgi:uridine kinase
VRTAITGTHRTGKTTLVAELSEALPQHVVGEDAYHTLV